MHTYCAKALFCEFKHYMLNYHTENELYRVRCKVIEEVDQMDGRFKGRKKDLIKAFSLNDYSFLLLFIITLALSVFAYIIIDIIPKCIKNVLRGEKND